MGELRFVPRCLSDKKLNNWIIGNRQQRPEMTYRIFRTRLAVPNLAELDAPLRLDQPAFPEV